MKSFILPISRGVRASSWHSAVKGGRRWYELILRSAHIIVGRVSKGYIASVLIFVRHCIKIRRRQGIPGLCKRLKACNVLLMQAIAGEKQPNSRELGAAISRCRAGYPRIIPLHHRRELARANPRVIRLWLSLFCFYRILDWKGVVKIETIVSPGKPRDPIFFEEYRAFLPTFFSKLKAVSGFDFLSYAGDPKKILKDFPMRYLCLTKSGPGTSGSQTTMSALPMQCNAWLHPENERIYSALDGWCILLGVRHITSFIQLCAQAWSYGYLASFVKAYRPGTVGSHPFSVCLGKLGFKEEPGKVRVFAMVDYITQVVMSPLHELMYKMLKSIPQDGTFDQRKPIELLIDELRLLDKQRQRSSWSKDQMGSVWSKVKLGRCYSFDLTAATDRLPVDYQALVVQQLHPKLGVTWRELLVGRYYHISDKAREKYDPNLPARVKYSVGQPMGALSSFAMLGVTHHILVQLAAHRAGFEGWFRLYAVLGDDVVIAHDKVASQYLVIMRTLGVGISMAKTLTGVNVMEFAKRFIVRGEDVSPVSLLEFLISLSHVSAFIELVRKMKEVSRLRFADVIKASGWSFRVSGSLDKDLWKMGSRTRNLMLLLLHPKAPFGVPSYIQWLFLRTRNSGYKPSGDMLDRMVQSFEDTVIGRLKEAVKRRSEDALSLGKLPYEVKLPGTKRFGYHHGLHGRVGDIMRDHVLFPIQCEVQDKLDQVREDVRSWLDYYRVRTRIISIVLTPEERTDMLLKIINGLEEKVSTLPLRRQLWYKTEPSDPKTSSKELIRWNRVRRIVLGLLSPHDSMPF